MPAKPLFHEEQQFRQPLLWTLLLGLLLLQLYGIYQQMVLKKPFGNNPASDTSFVIIILIYLGIMTFMYLIQLTIEVRDDLSIRFFPLMLKPRIIPIQDIEKAYVRTYSPLLDYGGWGVRHGLRSKGTAYNISGNKGVQLELTNGKKILLGTQKPEALKGAIEKLKHS